MEKLDRWIAKHQKASRVVMTLLWILWTLWMIDLELPKVVAVIFGVIGIFVFSVTISASGDRLLKRPLEIMEQQCDPYPMLQESAEQLDYPGNEAVKQIRTINYCLALRYVGEYEKAEKMLRSINIDKCPGLQPIVKAVYYNNLMDVCVLTGEYQEAKIWYEKAVQIFSDVKDGKLKQQLEKTITANRAWYYFADGEYEQTLRAIEQSRPEKPLQQIDTAMLCAHVYRGLGQNEKAAEALQYVLWHGNRLYAVQEARQMLAEMKTTPV